MFDIEQSISAWRRQMVNGGIRSRVFLDELESHLREDVQQQMRLGATGDTAFEAALTRLGGVRLLKTELEKENGEKPMKRVLIISAGVIAILVGMAFVMPAVAQYRDLGGLSGVEVVLLTLGITLTIGGAGVAYLGANPRKA